MHKHFPIHYMQVHPIPLLHILVATAHNAVLYYPMNENNYYNNFKLLSVYLVKMKNYAWKTKYNLPPSYIVLIFKKILYSISIFEGR